MQLTSLPVVGESYSQTTELDGKTWQCFLWHTSSRQLRRDVPGGSASISESHDQRYFLEIDLSADERVTFTSRKQFDDLLEAASAAETFTWKTVEHAGRTWFKDPNREIWHCAFGPGDQGELIKADDGRFLMKRSITPRYGETYEISVQRYNSIGTPDGTGLAVTSFAEAAAIVSTAPAYLSELVTR